MATVGRAVAVRQSRSYSRTAKPDYSVATDGMMIRQPPPPNVDILNSYCRTGDAGLVQSYLHDTVLTSSINQIDGGLAPIHEAAIGGHAEVIRLLCKEMDEIDVNIRADEGPALTALHMAAQRDHAEAVIALVECGAIINAVDRCWRTPKDIALEHDSHTVVHVISVFEMVKAAKCENITLLEKLLIKVTSYQQLTESLAQWNQSMLNNALLNAVKVGNRHIVGLLVKYGADNFIQCINCTNHISAFLVLCQAVLDENGEIIDVLLDRREEAVENHPLYQEYMPYRIILAPLLQNGKIDLMVPIQVALSNGKLAMAGKVLEHVSHPPSSGVIDWHDLELSYIDPHWLQGHGINSFTYIGLSSNKLRVVPEQILRFNNLQKVQIHHNRITVIPGDLLSLPRINHIDVSFNFIAALPPVLKQALSPSLESLNLSNNRLHDLPTYLKHSSLRSLDISSNRFDKVPDCILHIKMLHTLNLNGNIGIEVVPYELGKLRHLVLLGLEGLPYIRNIPSKEKALPLSFLRSRANNLQTVTHYDVAVVGTEEAYLPCLETVYGAIQQESKRKHFSCLKYSNRKQFLHFQQSLSLSCTVYVLVWDCQSRQPVNDILQQVLHLSLYVPPSSTIVVAACWTAAVTPTQEQWIDEQLASSHWKEFRDRVVMVTLSLNREGVVNRDHTIQYLLDTVDRKGSSQRTKASVPNSYSVLTDYVLREANRLLEDGKPPLINDWDMWELVRSSPQHDLSGKRELSLVLSFLSSVSSLLLLPSDRSDESNFHALNRQWFLDAMSGLLRRHQNLNISNGLYPAANICDLLSCSSLQSPLPHALYTSIGHIGLAIPVTSHDTLVPSMLPSHNAAFDDFSSQYHVKRVYTYRCTPAAFWPRLISHLLVNMNHLLTVISQDSSGEPVGGFQSLPDTLPHDLGNWNYWSEGMVVWLSGTTLVYSVEAITPVTEPSYREGIEIRVSNTEIGHRAVTILSATVNSLLKNWYPQLWPTVEVTVPCPDCAVDEDCRTLFPLVDCHKLLADKSLSLTCSRHLRPLNAGHLIPDVVCGDMSFVPFDKIDANIHDKSSCLSRPPSETVFRGEFNDTQIATKPFPPPNDHTKTVPLLDFYHELTILSRIRQNEHCPYIVEMLVATADPLSLVFPCAPFCSLHEVILETSIILLPLLRVRMVYQLASALEKLHQLKIIHRNVCLDNILVYSISLDDQINIKLGGFSSSCTELQQGLAVEEYGMFPAPEMSQSGYEYDQRVDVFSFAFTSYEMLTRKKLKFRYGVKFQTATGNEERPHLLPLGEMTPYFTPLLERCWHGEPSRRPFFTEIVTHFQEPLHILSREGLCVNEIHEFNAAAVRYTRQANGTFLCDLYMCSSVLSKKDSTLLSHMSLPGLAIKNKTSLPSQCIICMACSTDYLWVSFQFKFVRIYLATSLEFIKEIHFDCHVLVMAVSPDCIYLGKEDGEIQVYNLAQPSPLHASTHTRVIAYQQPIKSLQVLDDSVVCCTKRSFARIHPITLLTLQDFPTVSETEVKCAVVAVDRENDMEYLWVGFRRLQQLVVFNAITGQAIYGANCCEVLFMERSQVWVTCLQVVLDTVWAGLNTGHILCFNAYSMSPHLLTYLKAHSENVRQILLLQPYYWGNRADLYDDEHSTNDSEEEMTSLSLPIESIPMPRVVSTLSCGQGVYKAMPKVGTDGVVLRTRREDLNGLHVLKLDGPDAAGARKLECQAHRKLRPYMENYDGGTDDPIYENESFRNSTPSSYGHRTLPHAGTCQIASGTYASIQTVNPKNDPELNEWICVSNGDLQSSGAPPPVPRQPQDHPRQPQDHIDELSNMSLSDSDEEGSGYVQMRSATVSEGNQSKTGVLIPRAATSLPPATVRRVQQLTTSNDLTDDSSLSSNGSTAAASLTPSKRK